MAPEDGVARMARAWRELRRGPAAIRVRDELFGTGADAIDPANVDVLDLLVQRDDWRMNEVAAALCVDPSTVTRTLQRMEAAGLAVRTPHDSDGRVVRVQITEAGRQCQQLVAGRRQHVIGAILTRFDADERRQLVRLLERFLEGAYDHVGMTPPPKPTGVSPQPASAAAG